MPKLQETVELKSSPEKVFAYLDDIGNAGWHMTQHSPMMFGSKLDLEILSADANGVGATYRWRGKVLGIPIDFTEVVTGWVANKEKVWHTIGDPKLIILSSYEMRFVLTPQKGGTLATFEITCELPRSPLGKILGWLLAKGYSRWCLRRMGADAKRALEGSQTRS